MEKEREQLQQLLKEKGDTASSLADKEKELLLRHQAMENEIINKEKLLKQHENDRIDLQRLTKILSHAIQQINEANERAVLIGKNVYFQPELYREGSKIGLASTNVRIKVAYPDVDEDFPLYWSVSKLEERLVDIREICNQINYGIEFEEIDLGYDPFVEKVDSFQHTHQLIGNCYVYLEIIFYCISIDEDLIPIIDDHGKHKGSLRLSISIENKLEDRESLKEIIGKSLSLKVCIAQAFGIPENLCTNVYCEYNILNSEPHRTLSSTENTTSPQIDYEHIHDFTITQELIENIINNALVISVYGDITAEKRKRGLSVIRDHANFRPIASPLREMRSYNFGEMAEALVSSNYREMTGEDSFEPLNYSIHKEFVSLNSTHQNTTDIKAIIKAQKQEILRLRAEISKREAESMEKQKNFEKNAVPVETIREKSCACVLF